MSGDQAAKLQLSQAAPVVSIVVPCLNEELVIGEFVDWCMEGLRAANVSGEVLIIDSSTDRSAQIAAEHGARVIETPRRGLGQAYLDALPHVRGEIVIMGDCDLTYDFRNLKPFIEKIRQGAEFVMGSRLNGTIEDGAMPALHRYFGTPLTTKILNFIYHTRYTDIHCGMRAMTVDALRRLNLQSTGWEYASEMVLKSARLRLKSAEIPIAFYKDREGRTSHHKRSGWLSPWKAGWDNVRMMLLFAPDFLLFRGGILMFVAGIVLVGMLAIARHTIMIGRVGLNLYSMLLGLTLATVGYSAIHLALFSRVFYEQPGLRTRWAMRIFTYNRGMVVGGVLMLLGFILEVGLLIDWLRHHLRLEQISYSSVLGLLLIILGFQTVTHTLVLQMLILSRKKGAEA
ncbi:MAG TPA: glycosyltransferase family 2 protein [Tepidisphaeraceae bacterium]|nr:glycosyltransferase family 2 protein [Tepidisphaeraceae bacterium]